MSLRVRYLLQESILVLLLGYLVLLGGTFNGLVLYPLNQLTAIIIGMIGVIWFGTRLIRGQAIARTPLDAPLFVFLAAYAVATFLSTDPVRSLGYLGLMALYVLAFYLVSDLVQAGWPAELFVKALLVVSLIVLFFGAWEIERWLADWLAIGGWAHPIPPTTLRIRAFLGHPNFVAAFLNLLLPLALARLVQSRARVPRTLLAVWSLIALVLIFFTSSRGGWLGTAAALGTWVVLTGQARREQVKRLWRICTQNRWWLAGIATVALVLVVMIGALAVRQSQNASHGPLLESRNIMWLPAWRAFVQSPLSGTGPFTFASTYLKANSVPPEGVWAHAHNYALNIATETGLLGLMPLLWLAATMVLSLWRRWHQADTAEHVFLAGAVASLVGIAVHSLFDTPQTMPTMDLLIAIILGIVVMGPNTVCVPVRRWPALWSWLTLIFLMVMAGWGWSLWTYAPFVAGVDATNRGQWREAASWLTRAAERNPRLAFFQFQAGYADGYVAMTESDGAELDAALSHYRAGAAIDSSWAANLGNLAALYEQSGQRAEAIRWMDRAAQIAPGEAAFPLNLARYYEMAGDTTAATQAYGRALDLRPVWADLPFWKQTDLRQRALQEWRAAHPDLDQPLGWPTLQSREGWDALNEGKPEDARAFFAARTSRNDGTSYLGLGLADMELGRLDEADQALQTSLFIGMPVYAEVEATFARGQVAFRRHDVQAAIELGEAALNGLTQTTILGPGTLGQSDYGWYVYNRASIAPDLLPQFVYPTLTDHVLTHMMDLAMWHEQNGDREAAMRVLSQVIEADPDNRAAREWLNRLMQ